MMLQFADELGLSKEERTQLEQMVKLEKDNPEAFARMMKDGADGGDDDDDGPPPLAGFDGCNACGAQESKAKPLFRCSQCKAVYVCPFVAGKRCCVDVCRRVWRYA